MAKDVRFEYFFGVFLRYRVIGKVDFDQALQILKFHDRAQLLNFVVCHENLSQIGESCQHLDVGVV